MCIRLCAVQGVSSATPEPELRRAVAHETGHVLGFRHRGLAPEVIGQIDPVKAYVWFR